MMCAPAKEWMVSAWTGDLDRTTESKLREHLETCEYCRLETNRCVRYITPILSAMFSLP